MEKSEKEVKSRLVSKIILVKKKYEIFVVCNGIGVIVIEKGKILKMKRKNELNVCYYLLVGLVKGKEKEF